MKTFVPKIMNGADRKWYLIDAKDKVLGKIAVEITNILRGKNKTIFTPHLDLGDYVVVINAEKVKLTGENKLRDKKYYSHSGYLGNLKTTSAEEMMEKNPTRILELAIKGMIPRNKLRKDVLERLKIFVGEEHEHKAQTPKIVEI